MQAGLPKGFECEYDAGRQVLIMRFLGVWNRELATQCERQLHERAREISASADAWYLVLDFTRCMPMSDEVRDIIWQAIEFARRQGLRNTAIVVNGTLVGFKRTSPAVETEMRVDFYFQSQADAVRWLLEEPYDTVANTHTTKEVTV